VTGDSVVEVVEDDEPADVAVGDGPDDGDVVATVLDAGSCVLLPPQPEANDIAATTTTLAARERYRCDHGPRWPEKPFSATSPLWGAATRP